MRGAPNRADPSCWWKNDRLGSGARPASRSALLIRADAVCKFGLGLRSANSRHVEIATFSGSPLCYHLPIGSYSQQDFRTVEAKTTVSNTRPSALRLQNNAILALLLAIAVAAWTLLVWHQGHHARMDMPVGAPALYREVSHFLADWTVMMVAMMIPAGAAMAIAFHEMKVAKCPRENAFASTWVFVSASLLVWVIAGFAAYGGGVFARTLPPPPALSSAAL